MTPEPNRPDEREAGVYVAALIAMRDERSQMAMRERAMGNERNTTGYQQEADALDRAIALLRRDAPREGASEADIERRLDAMVEEYEWSPDGCGYTPKPREKLMLLDFAHGILADDEFVRLARSFFNCPPAADEPMTRFCKDCAFYVRGHMDRRSACTSPHIKPHPVNGAQAGSPERLRAIGGECGPAAKWFKRQSELLTPDRAPREGGEAVSRADLPPLPEWSKADDLGGLLPSDIRGELRAYGIKAIQRDRAHRPQPAGSDARAAWNDFLAGNVGASPSSDAVGALVGKDRDALADIAFVAWRDTPAEPFPGTQHPKWLAVVDELAAALGSRPVVDEAMVERAAESLYVGACGPNGTPVPWAELTRDQKWLFKVDARAALTAALRAPEQSS